MHKIFTIIVVLMLFVVVVEAEQSDAISARTTSELIANQLSEISRISDRKEQRLALESVVTVINETLTSPELSEPERLHLLRRREAIQAILKATVIEQDAAISSEDSSWSKIGSSAAVSGGERWRALLGDQSLSPVDRQTMVLQLIEVVTVQDLSGFFLVDSKDLRSDLPAVLSNHIKVIDETIDKLNHDLEKMRKRKNSDLKLVSKTADRLLETWSNRIEVLSEADQSALAYASFCEALRLQDEITETDSARAPIGFQSYGLILKLQKDLPQLYLLVHSDLISHDAKMVVLRDLLYALGAPTQKP